MRTVAELIRNASLVRKVWLEKNVVRVAFNTMEEVIVGDAEEVGDDWHAVTAETEPLCSIILLFYLVIWVFLLLALNKEQ